MKPIIGLTCNFDTNDKYYDSLGVGDLGQRSWSVISNDYAEAIIRSGGITLLIPVVNDEEYLKSVADLVDGLVFTGGSDLDPLLANQRPTKKIGKIAPERDEEELFLLEYFYSKTKKPIFGVCRGMQLMTVYFKGQLILDIQSEGYLDHSLSANNSWNFSHSVKVDKDSVLYSIVNKEDLFVNSYHHQGAKVIPENFKPVAISEDGIVEAFEDKNIDDRFIMAVQWHPEMLSRKHGDHQKIFDYFIDKCKK